MSNPKTSPIVGEVQKCEVKTSKAGTQFATIHVKAINKTRKGGTEEVVYIMTAFSYHAPKFLALRVGDYINAVCDVTMDTYRPEWPAVKLLVDTLEVLNTSIPGDEKKEPPKPEQSQAQEPGQTATWEANDEEDPLPF